MKTEFVPRVNQLDALLLDNDILRIIRDQLTKALQNLSPGLLSRLTPELDFLIRTAIWSYSVRLHSATFGQRLLFISYDKNQLFSNYKIQLHFILNVFLKYARDNVTFRLTNRRSLQQLLAYCEYVITIFDMLNFFRFLRVGKRPSLADYVLQLDNISMHGNRRREIGYSHMTRELIWGGFMELLGFTLPLVNYHFLKRKCRNVVAMVMGVSLPNSTCGRPRLTLDTKCEYCDERPTLPHHMGCQHIFCYYCLRGNLLADLKFECPTCNWNSDVIEPV